MQLSGIKSVRASVTTIYIDITQKMLYIQNFWNLPSKYMSSAAAGFPLCLSYQSETKTIGKMQKKIFSFCLHQLNNQIIPAHCLLQSVCSTLKSVFSTAIQYLISWEWQELICFFPDCIVREKNKKAKRTSLW